MATLPAVSSEPVVARIGAADSVKYRLSCDRCQSTKVRCNQDKPTCKRCAQKGVICVYSPLRRKGRPKKVSSDNVNSNEQDLESTIRTTPSSDNFSTVDTEMSDAQFTGAGFSQHVILDPSGSNERPLHSAVHPWILDRQSPIAAQSHGDQSHSIASRGTNMNSEASVFNERVNWSYASSISASAPNRITETPGHSLEANCYTAILTQTAKVVQALAPVQEALPLGIDLVFEAERDFYSLQQHLFTCTGHDLTPLSSQQQQPEHSNDINNRRGQSCLASEWPILLSLALLAEHVVGMLENIFHMASQAALSLDKSMVGIEMDIGMGMGVSWSGADAGAASYPSARRLQRSYRSLWHNPCVSPLVEASRDLLLGDFLVENPAKSKAMRRILTRRVGRMLQVLQVMRNNTKERGGGASQGIEVPLDWGGSRSLMSDLANTLVKDLIRRVESLQGAIILIRNDKII